MVVYSRLVYDVIFAALFKKVQMSLGKVSVMELLVIIFGGIMASFLVDSSSLGGDDKYEGANDAEVDQNMNSSTLSRPSPGFDSPSSVEIPESLSSELAPDPLVTDEEGFDSGDDILNDDEENIQTEVILDEMLFGTILNDTINGGSGDDIIDGGPGDDVIHGGQGGDILDGDDGDDTLFGSTEGQSDNSVDFLFGGNGNDVLVLGSGDLVTGGQGEDHFSIEFSGAGYATINDFNPADDRISIAIYGESGSNPQISTQVGSYGETLIMVDQVVVTSLSNGASIDPDDISVILKY
jgi:Ca2+-binding RTX toxin-like protein